MERYSTLFEFYHGRLFTSDRDAQPYGQHYCRNIQHLQPEEKRLHYLQ